MTLPSSECSRHEVLDGPRRGMSLLEVLVASAILIVGLASVAAILPAAAARLGDAAAHDRAAATIAVAMSEIQIRSLYRTHMFPGGGTTSPAAIVFGDTLPAALLPAATGNFLSGTAVVSGTFLSGSRTRTGTSFVSVTSTFLVGASPTNVSHILTTGSLGFVNPLSATSAILVTPAMDVLHRLISSDTTLASRRGFMLEDEVQYGGPLSAQPQQLQNVFTTSGTQGVHVRQFNRGASWGALVIPEPWGSLPVNASAMRVSVAAFRRPGTARVIQLTGTSTVGLFRTGASFPSVVQKRWLAPCSSVLAIPPSGTSGPGPQWLTIRSSWVTGTSVSPITSATTATLQTGICSVVFQAPPPATLMVSGTVLTVIGFENLLLVNEQTFPAR